MFYLFKIDNNYDQGALDSHLNYLLNWGGSPDYNYANENLVVLCNRGAEMVDECGVSVAVVDESLNIIYEIE